MIRIKTVSHLVLDDGVVRKTQISVGFVSELKGTLVELRNGLVHVQDGVLLVHLPNHLKAPNTCFQNASLCKPERLIN